jgi:hypothetical protein
VRGGYPRPIVNAVSRGSHNLDGKKWSGHLVEPITMDVEKMAQDVEENRKMIFDYVRNYAGLRPKGDENWYVGETYFPSPDRIDEAIEPVFVEVENPNKTSWPVRGDKNMTFIEQGSVMELDGADIILASQVGLLPEPRLEMHVFDLMTRNNIALPRWIGEEMPKLPGQPVKTHDPEDVLKEAERTEFEEEKRDAVHLKPVKAVFVEEGKVGGATRGLSAQDIEFIVTDDGVENIAVVLPLSRDWDNNLLVALEPKIMPAPNRLGGDGAMLNAPTFVLPKDVRTLEDAKAFIAEKFSVPVDNVGTLGESYFTHVGVTPQRIYPFSITSPAEASADPKRRFMMVKKLMKLGVVGRLTRDTMKLLARTQMRMGAEHSMTMDRNMDNAKNKGFSLSTEKVALGAKDSGYSAVPSRILGQRGAVVPKAQHGAPARTAGRLSQSYTKAKVSVKETPAIEKVGKDIDAVAEKLKNRPENPKI